MEEKLGKSNKWEKMNKNIPLDLNMPNWPFSYICCDPIHIT